MIDALLKFADEATAKADVTGLQALVAESGKDLLRGFRPDGAGEGVSGMGSTVDRQVDVVDIEIGAIENARHCRSPASLWSIAQ